MIAVQTSAMILQMDLLHFFIHFVLYTCNLSLFEIKGYANCLYLYFGVNVLNLSLFVLLFGCQEQAKETVPGSLPETSSFEACGLESTVN